MEEHLVRDFFDDGGHSERAPRNYTLATYLAYRNLYYLLQAHQVRPETMAKIQQTMGKTLEWWITMLTPLGEVPAINDSHRGLFPSTVLLDGATLFQKPEAYAIARSLLGARSRDGSVFPSFTSRHMRSSGFTVMRTDWTRDALYMNINHGPSGGPHTHADLLSFELYAYGRALAVDAGIGMTYDDPLYIPWYKSSRAHNMVVVNDRNMVREGIAGERIQWESLGQIEYFAGEHRGYDSLGVRHTRRIVFVKPRFWFVYDELQCTRSGDTLSWYLHSPTNLIPFSTGYRSSTVPGLLVLPTSGTFGKMTGLGTAASTSVRLPGKVETASWIRFDQISSMGAILRYPVLLYPFQSSPSGIRCTEESPGLYEILDGEQRNRLVFAGARDPRGEIRTDAELAVLSYDDGRMTSYAVVGGTYLTVDNRAVFQSTTKKSTSGPAPR